MQQQKESIPPGNKSPHEWGCRGDFARFALIGSELAQSQSDRCHNAYFLRKGISAHYEKIPLQSAQFPVFMAGLRQAGLRGLSVTLPYKETILPYLDGLDTVASQIGAVNTVVCTPEGRCLGYNTDASGVRQALESHVGSLHGQRILILGAGGAARAAVWALQQAGAMVWVTNRTLQRAIALAEAFGAAPIPLDHLTPSFLASLNGFIQSTPFTSDFSGAPFFFPRNWLSPHLWVLEMGLQPSALLQAALSRGCKALSGWTMWVHQALAQYRLWMPYLPESAFDAACLAQVCQEVAGVKSLFSLRKGV